MGWFTNFLGETLGIRCFLNYDFFRDQRKVEENKYHKKISLLYINTKENFKHTSSQTVLAKLRAVISKIDIYLRDTYYIFHRAGHIQMKKLRAQLETDINMVNNVYGGSKEYLIETEKKAFIKISRYIEQPKKLTRSKCILSECLLNFFSPPKKFVDAMEKLRDANLRNKMPAIDENEPHAEEKTYEVK